MDGKIGAFTYGDGVFAGLSGAGRGGRRAVPPQNRRGAGDLYRLYGYVFGVTAAEPLVMTRGRGVAIYLAAAGLVAMALLLTSRLENGLRLHCRRPHVSSCNT